MQVNLVERQDLDNCKKEVIREITSNVQTLLRDKLQKEWLIENEAMELLNISKSTIQNYRRSRQLPFSQFGNKIYYKYKDIVDFLTQNYVDNGTK